MPSGCGVATGLTIGLPMHSLALQAVIWGAFSATALAVFAGPSLVRLALFDARQRRACGNQPRPLANTLNHGRNTHVR